jgi:hypothetical protein
MRIAACSQSWCHVAVGRERQKQCNLGLRRMHGSPHESAVVSDVFIIIGPKIAPRLIRLYPFIGQYELLRKSSVTVVCWHAVA